MAIQCQHCDDRPAIANISVIWIDNLNVENANVYLCMTCIDIRYPSGWVDE